MNKSWIILLISMVIYPCSYATQVNYQPVNLLTLVATSDQLKQVFNERKSKVQVQGAGLVTKILADDTKGAQHQRFILRLDNGQSLLIAHNIDLAARINNLAIGDQVQFFGQYEWNAKGGVVHWTHHDPKGKHIAGWLKHNGKMYQ